MSPTLAKLQLSEPNIAREEVSNLILAFARVVYVNGDSTRRTVETVERISKCQGFRAVIFPRWRELELETEDTHGKLISAIEAVPFTIHPGEVSGRRSHRLRTQVATDQ
jgi:hypothetical protein